MKDDGNLAPSRKIWPKIERRIGYRFKDRMLLEVALVHARGERKEAGAIGFE